MTGGYHADPDELLALAGRLEEVAGELRAAACSLGGATAGELGPAGIPAALAGLTGAWSGRLRSVDTEFGSAVAGVRAAAKAYADAEERAAGELRHGG
ncbi:hypothetical protein [Amycolatopsis sp. H20-H5]|uniref:hypothetical protein n=1 Tax=Amycolatopsis sp. H20-H5 TaxID=3046309 RepID=UPI002DBF95BD|nr:hypothetical protein [Amycolatopsis sp. H20-H5]MEC3976721.1 hypothetical protein [Amycolatopsis sp. H20-H5]